MTSNLRYSFRRSVNTAVVSLVGSNRDRNSYPALFDRSTGRRSSMRMTLCLSDVGEFSAVGHFSEPDWLIHRKLRDVLCKRIHTWVTSLPSRNQFASLFRDIQVVPPSQVHVWCYPQDILADKFFCSFWWYVYSWEELVTSWSSSFTSGMVTKSWLSKTCLVNLASAHVLDSCRSVEKKNFESFIMSSQLLSQFLVASIRDCSVNTELTDGNNSA